MSNNIPANASPTVLPVERRLAAPSPDATALVRVVTEPLALLEDSDSDSVRAVKKRPTVWIIDQEHPLTGGGAKILRMFRDGGGGITVYSSDGILFVRTYIPDRCVRFADEVMSEQTFIAFIEQEEEEEPDDDEDDADEEEEEEAPQAAAPPVAPAAPDAAS